MPWYETTNEIGFNVRQVEEFRTDTFRRLTLEGVTGVALVVGKLLPEKVADGADPESMVAHTYRFAKTDWTLDQAKTWVTEQKIEENPETHASGMKDSDGESVTLAQLTAEAVWEETENEIRYRVQDPEDFRKDTFRYVTLKGIEGVRIVVGKLLPENVPDGADPEAMVLQAYRFDRALWDLDRAKKWIEAREGSSWMVWEALWNITYGGVHREMKTERLKTMAVRLVATEDDTTDTKRFSFTLCHVGTNKNGDHFTKDELKKAAGSAVGKKVDLSHHWEIRDIVGIITDAKYIEAGDLSRVDCEGELFTSDTDAARLAYRLMKTGIIANVSMECAYAEGECSYCGQRHTSRANYCIHLRSYKAGQYHDKPVYEILHDITFTGVGLLDEEGADPGATIQQIAARDKERSMDIEQLKARIAELEAQIKADAEKAKAEKDALEAQVATLQAKVDELESEKKAIARKARAEQLLETWEKKGRTFASEEDRTAELTRLEGLADEKFEATEEAVAALDDKVTTTEEPPTTQANRTRRPMQAQAKPGDPPPVPDGQPTYRNNLTAVLTKLAGGEQEG